MILQHIGFYIAYFLFLNKVQTNHPESLKIFSLDVFGDKYIICF